MPNIKESHKSFGISNHEITYADKNQQQINFIASIIHYKFNLKIAVYKRPNAETWIGRINCRALHWYFCTRLGIPSGKRKNTKIPKWLYNKKEFISNFLSGFYDAEGDLNTTTHGNYKGKKYPKIRIQLTQKDQNLLTEVQSVLFEFYNIKSCIHKKWNQNTYILKIDARNSINVFTKEISFRM